MVNFTREFNRKNTTTESITATLICKIREQIWTSDLVLFNLRAGTKQRVNPAGIKRSAMHSWTIINPLKLWINEPLNLNVDETIGPDDLVLVYKYAASQKLAHCVTLFATATYLHWLFTILQASSLSLVKIKNMKHKLFYFFNIGILVQKSLFFKGHSSVRL
jgi:hypothetical protein